MKIKPTKNNVKWQRDAFVVFIGPTKPLTRMDATWCLLFTECACIFGSKVRAASKHWTSTRMTNSGEGKLTLAICGLKCGRVDWIVSNVVFGMRREKFSTWKFIKRNAWVNTNDYFYSILLFEMWMFVLRKQMHLYYFCELLA